MTLIQDVRYALRQLRKTPGFTVTAVLTLALGIGANAAIFTLLHAILLKNLPVVDPKTLVRVGSSNECCVNSGRRDNGNYSLFPTDTWLLMKKNAPELEELAAMQAGFGYNPITVRRDGDPAAQSMVGEFVSGNYFRTFGLRPEAGRLLTDSDDAKSAPMTAVMSYAAWQRDYNGDPAVVGSTFWVNTKAVTITGIAPKGFYGDRMSPTPPEFYLPIESMGVIASSPFVDDPDVQWLYIIGRVKPGVSLPALQQRLSALLRQSFEHTKPFSEGEGKRALAKAHVVLTPGGGGIQSLQQDSASAFYMLMTISGLVLLIACANIANLLLARGMSRKAEMSLRTALGATRRRVIQQLLTESLALALLGGAAGLLVAYLGAKALLSLAFAGAPIEASPSLPVLGFAFGLSLLTGVLFGVAPAWIAARTEPADALRSGSRTTTTRASLLQRGLVVTQAALSLVLLVGAGLFTQSLSKLEHADMGLDARNRYVVHFNAQAAGYTPTQVEALYRTMEDRFHALPGVVKVGISSYTPMEDNNWGTGVRVQGQPDAGKDAYASIVRVSPEYFDSVGTRVVMGRGITVQDTSTAPSVAVVNKTFVKKFFHGKNPIGQHFGGSDKSAGDYEIVGVVEDSAYVSVRWTDHQMYFIPLVQRPASSAKEPIEKDTSLYAGAIVLETERPMNDMESLARRTLAGINPNLTIVKFQTFSQQIADRFKDDRTIASLTMMFGGLALLLAAVGLYGVTAYTVALRTSEIGIRMALGAERRSVVAMIMRGAVTQAGIGLAIGVPVALLCVRFVKDQLYEITNADARVMAFAIVTLAVAACVAGVIPARRAASIDPMQALRVE